MSGYTVTREDGAGIRVEGAAPSDEVHTGDVSGSVNVSRIWRDIETGLYDRVLFTIDMASFPPDYFERQDVDREHAARLTEAQLERPCIVLIDDERRTCLVDGTHRLMRKRARGDSEFRAYAVPLELAELYRVTVWTRDPGAAAWRLQTPAERLDEMRGTYPTFDSDGRLSGYRREAQP
jgi:hypothetical protein